MKKGMPPRNGARLTGCLIVVLCLAMTTASSADSTSPVPIDHGVYPLLERLQTRGWIQGLDDGMRPLSEARVRALLKQATNQSGLQGIDRQRAEQFAALLAPAEDAAGFHRASLWSATSPMRYGTDQGWLDLDLLARQQTDVLSGRRDGREWVLRNRLGAVVRGQIGEGIGFRISFEQTREEGLDRGYRIRSDVFETRREAVQLKGGVADYHEATAIVSFDLGDVVDVMAGKGQVMWGPAPDDNLGLSANSPSYDMVLLRSRLGVLRFEHLVARLRPCPDRPDAPICGDPVDAEATYIVNGMTRPLERDKYLAAHRLEISPRPWLDIGLQEVVIYGDRGPDG